MRIQPERRAMHLWSPGRTVEPGRAAYRRPLPLANHGCARRVRALGRVGIDYRIAYSSENGAGQCAAALADLAVAALPAGLLEPPLIAIRDLPTLATTRIALIQRPGAGAQPIRSRFVLRNL